MTQVSAALTPLVIHPRAALSLLLQPVPVAGVRAARRPHGERLTRGSRCRPSSRSGCRCRADVPPGSRCSSRLHEVIRENAHKLYPGMRLTDPTLFRLTRDAEVEMDEDAGSGPAGIGAGADPAAALRAGRAAGVRRRGRAPASGRRCRSASRSRRRTSTSCRRARLHEPVQIAGLDRARAARRSRGRR